MKKAYSLVLAMVVLAALLTGCAPDVNEPNRYYLTPAGITVEMPAELYCITPGFSLDDPALGLTGYSASDLTAYMNTNQIQLMGFTADGNYEYGICYRPDVEGLLNFSTADDTYLNTVGQDDINVVSTTETFIYYGIYRHPQSNFLILGIETGGNRVWLEYYTVNNGMLTYIYVICNRGTIGPAQEETLWKIVKSLQMNVDAKDGKAFVSGENLPISLAIDGGVTLVLFLLPLIIVRAVRKRPMKIKSAALVSLLYGVVIVGGMVALKLLLGYGFYGVTMAVGIPIAILILSAGYKKSQQQFGGAPPYGGYPGQQPYGYGVPQQQQPYGQQQGMPYNQGYAPYGVQPNPYDNTGYIPQPQHTPPAGAPTVPYITMPVTPAEQQPVAPGYTPAPGTQPADAAWQPAMQPQPANSLPPVAAPVETAQSVAEPVAAQPVSEIPAEPAPVTAEKAAEEPKPSTKKEPAEKAPKKEPATASKKTAEASKADPAADKVTEPAAKKPAAKKAAAKKDEPQTPADAEAPAAPKKTTAKKATAKTAENDEKTAEKDGKAADKTEKAGAAEEKATETPVVEPATVPVVPVPAETAVSDAPPAPATPAYQVDPNFQFCAQCGAKYPAAGRFCPECGTKSANN